MSMLGGSLPLACRASLLSEGSRLDHVTYLQPFKLRHEAEGDFVRESLFLHLLHADLEDNLRIFTHRLITLGPTGSMA